ncbi:MAG: helix-turn-helix domain-containing protein [Candidatus Aminicenantes bacterium]|nr:helix-turn-helix domain-containing protein [Candidatus Aminicenantes bacterium]
MNRERNEFGARLKEVRETMNLSVEEMSSKLGVLLNSYYKYEDSSRFPKPAVLFFLANELDVNINYLLTGAGDKFISPNRPRPVKSLKEIFPDIPLDKEVVELIVSLEVPIMRNSLIVKYLLDRKNYEGLIKDYFEQKKRMARGG